MTVRYSDGTVETSYHATEGEAIRRLRHAKKFDRKATASRTITH